MHNRTRELKLSLTIVSHGKFPALNSKHSISPSSIFRFYKQLVNNIIPFLIIFSSFYLIQILSTATQQYNSFPFLIIFSSFYLLYLLSNIQLLDNIIPFLTIFSSFFLIQILSTATQQYNSFPFLIIFSSFYLIQILYSYSTI